MAVINVTWQFFSGMAQAVYKDEPVLILTGLTPNFDTNKVVVNKKGDSYTVTVDESVIVNSGTTNASVTIKSGMGDPVRLALGNLTESKSNEGWQTFDSDNGSVGYGINGITAGYYLTDDEATTIEYRAAEKIDDGDPYFTVSGVTSDITNVEPTQSDKYYTLTVPVSAIADPESDDTSVNITPNVDDGFAAVLKLGDDVKERKESNFWSEVTNNSSIYQSALGPGYVLNDAETEITYVSDTDEGEAYFSIYGINTTEGIDVTYKEDIYVVTVPVSAVANAGSQKEFGLSLSDEGDYTSILALGAGLNERTESIGWTTVNENSSTYGVILGAGYYFTDEDSKQNVAYTDESELSEADGSSYFSLNGIVSTEGITVSGTTITLTSSVLNGTDVTLKNGEGNNYVLAVDSTITEPKDNSGGSWSYSNSDASFSISGKTEGYQLSDDKNTLVYIQPTGGITLATVTGVTSTDGLTVHTDTKIVEVGSASLGTSNVTIESVDGYTLKLATGVAEPTRKDAGFTEVSDGSSTYHTESTTAGYTLENNQNQITYTAESLATDLFTLTGIKTTEGITVSDTTITLTSSALNGKTVTLTNSGTDNYELDIDDTITEPVVTAAGWSYSDPVASYNSASTSAGYTLSNSTTLTYTAAKTSEPLVTVNGVTSTSGLSIDTDSKVVEVGSASLGTSNVTIDNNYKLALANGIDAPVTTDAHFDNLTYKSKSNTAGYTLADNQITYNAAVAATDLFTLTGVKTTDGITVSDTTVTLTAANLNKTDVTISNSTYT